MKFPIPVRRRAAFEPEVVACFATLIAGDRLPGYKLLGIPGNQTRYDALFEFRTDVPANVPKGEGIPLGIDKSRFVNNEFVRTNQWLEFKVTLAGLLENFALDDGDSSKKYFEQVNLAVVWQLGGTADDSGYFVEPVAKQNWTQRNFYGSTHLVRYGDSRHVVEVIELETLLGRLFPK